MKLKDFYDQHFFEYDWESVNLNKSGVGLSAFEDLLPVKGLAHFSLGEGNTPLTHASQLGSRYGLTHLFIKHEELNPTGSFKDRESVVSIALAKQKGLEKVVIVSSGNAALSLSAYAQKAKLRCVCFVPLATSAHKKSLIRFFGGEVHEVDGNYEQIYREIAGKYSREFNMTAGICSERVEGNKTVAYEIWKDLNNVPDVVVVPCGNGGNLAGIWRGFFDLQKMGKIKKIPKMIAVQVKGAAPLVEAIRKNKAIQGIPNTVDSIAEGILAEESYCSPKSVTAINSSLGFVIEVTEQEIIYALKESMSCESLVIEPTSAAAFAALPKLKDFGVGQTEKVVVISTGSGMKMLDELQSI